MKITNFAINVGAKMDDLREEIKTVKKGEGLSENTIHTKLYKLTREFKTLSIILTMAQAMDAEGLEDIDLSPEQAEFFETLVRTQDARKAIGTIEVKDGDNVLTLCQRYPNKTLDSLTKTLAKQGWSVGNDGSIVRK